MSRKNAIRFLVHDFSIVFLSVLVAIVLVKTDALSVVLTGTAGFEFLGSFIAGMFFTSVFTTAPAIVTLGEIAQEGSVLATAFFGALGAIVGDLVIFKFIKDKLSDHFFVLVKHNSWWKRMKALFKLKYFRWGTFLLGGFIIASPFPDELGISLMGLSKMNTKVFMIISFIFNFVGILIIGTIAQSL